MSETLLTTGHLSAVMGVGLADGRQVVVKVRPGTFRRISGCVDFQRDLHSSGFPCPEPLAGPSAFSPNLWATAETYVPGGAQLDPGTGGDRPALFANALAEMVGIEIERHPRKKRENWKSMGSLPSIAQRLDPAPPWAWPDADALWPAPDDLEADLNLVKGPEWLDELGGEVRGRLAQSLAESMPSVVGHADFTSDNIRWKSAHSKELHVVHDWDSVAALPEPAIAGLASAIFTMTGEAGTEASIEESGHFLECYQSSRAVEWSRTEVAVAWAAGLWVRAFDAKKGFVRGDDSPGRKLREELPTRVSMMRGG